MCVHMNGVQEYLQAITGCTSVCAKRLFFSTRTACLCKVLFFFKVNGSSPFTGLTSVRRRDVFCNLRVTVLVLLFY